MSLQTKKSVECQNYFAFSLVSLVVLPSVIGKLNSRHFLDQSEVVRTKTKNQS